jgi:hypothetical protein
MTAAVSWRKGYRCDLRCSPPQMYHFEDKRSGPVAVDNAQVLPLVFAIVTFIWSLSVTIIHAIVRRKAKGWKEWNRSDKLIRKTPLPLRLYIY